MGYGVAKWQTTTSKWGGQDRIELIAHDREGTSEQGSFMFTGRFKHSLDAKGRVSIPKKFLERIPDHGTGRLLHGTRGFDRCVYLVCPDVWDRLVQKVEEAPMGDRGVRKFARVFYSWAAELPVDSSGRILLPPEYRQMLELGPERKEVLLLGTGPRIELWSPSVWDAESQSAEEGYEEYANQIFGA